MMTYPEIAELGITWRPRPRWIPQFAWRWLVDLTTRPDHRVRKGVPVLRVNVVVPDNVVRIGMLPPDKRDDMVVAKLCRDLGPSLVKHLAGGTPRVISVTLESVPHMAIDGEDFHMTVWEFKD